MNQFRQIASLIYGAFTLLVAPMTLPVMTSTPVTADPAPMSENDIRASLKEVLGTSGEVRALFGTPGSLEQRPELRPLIAGLPLDVPGVYPLKPFGPDRDSLVVVSLEPFGATRSTRLGNYRFGRWPTGGLAVSNPKYAAPDGYITVTPENEFTQVSKRFRLGDFLTHDQQDVWPKVLVLRATLLDKLELIGAELERRGLPSRLHIMSGFRTPQYNALGVGPKGGRARDSRHMYGDAADVIVDANGDGRMDDLDHDGKSTVRDARVLFAVAEDVEAQHPDLVGGLSAYRATSAHGPFVHVDTRGTRARW
jgi:hypothetical protein